MLLTEHRDQEVALRVLMQALHRNGIPEKSTIDCREANAAAITRDNEEHGGAMLLRQVKYSNSMIEQDQRGVNRMTRPMLRVASFDAAQATLVGIMLRHMKTGKLVREVGAEGLTPVGQCYALTASFPHGRGPPLHDLLSNICDIYGPTDFAHAQRAADGEQENEVERRGFRAFGTVKFLSFSRKLADYSVGIGVGAVEVISH